ncbi:MAG TPA: hypothetical protein VGF58_10630 [Burkholderiales bacterium]
MEDLDEWHSLSGKQYLISIGVGVLTSVILSAIMVTALKIGVSPMPAPVSLVFAQTLFGTDLPLPVGLLFHVAWVTFWSVFYVVFFWEHLTLARATGLAVFLLALMFIVIFPFIGWGLFGMDVGPRAVVGGVVTHALFAIMLWALAYRTFGTQHEPAGQRLSHA